MKRLKTYFTFLSRNKLFTCVNVAGLSISMMFVLLIANMVTRQLTIDRHVPDADRIYVLANEWNTGGHYQLGDRLKSRYPEIEDWSSMGGSTPLLLSQNDNVVHINTLFVKENFFDFFHFKLIEGNAKDVLVDDNSAVISRSCANRLFGTTQVIGKVLSIKSFDKQYVITGIAEDIDNSIFPAETEVFLPQINVKYYNESSDIEDTHMNFAFSSELFFRFVPGFNPQDKAADMAAYFKEFFWIYKNSLKEVRFIPMHDFYFSELHSYLGLKQYSFTQVFIFATAGILILLMAIFNYVSMSVAQTSYRAKEMATCRLLGSSRRDIFWHMIEESLLLTTGAFLLGFILAKSAEPYAIELLQVKTDLAGDLSVPVVLTYLAFILLLSFLSGFAPGTILSHYNPMDVVKGTFRRKTKALYLRLLSIAQMGLTLAMLTCALYLSIQIYRILHTPLGYTHEHILNYTPVSDLKAIHLFRDEARKLPFVRRVCLAQGTPVNGGNNSTMSVTGNKGEEEISFQYFKADSSFIPMFGIQITEDRRMPYDPSTFFFSRTAIDKLKEIGITDYFTTTYDQRIQIAGTFENFKIRSLMSPQLPLMMQITPKEDLYPWNILVQVQGDKPHEYKKQLDALYSRMVQGLPFESRWYDDLITDIYSDAIRMNKLMVVFTFTALLISLLGLTAMSIYFIAQRKRDMAVRRVFGASISNEVFRLMKFSFGSFCISLLVAIPLTVMGILQIDKAVPYESIFPYWVPAAAFLLVCGFSLATVYLIGLKATRENPVNNLKTE